MSCSDCQKQQELAFDKNLEESTWIAYVRIESANVALVGCAKHLKMLLEKIKKA